MLRSLRQLVLHYTINLRVLHTHISPQHNAAISQTSCCSHHGQMQDTSSVNRDFLKFLWLCLAIVSATVKFDGKPPFFQTKYWITKGNTFKTLRLLTSVATRQQEKCIIYEHLHYAFMGFNYRINDCVSLCPRTWKFSAISKSGDIFWIAQTCRLKYCNYFVSRYETQTHLLPLI